MHLVQKENAWRASLSVILALESGWVLVSKGADYTAKCSLVEAR